MPAYGPSPVAPRGRSRGSSGIRPRGDRSIRNFRFNPAYRVDLVLFHQILGQVTDAMYVKPKLRWDIFPGLSLDAQLVYSRALEATSTPSVAAGRDRRQREPRDRGGQRC